MTEYQVQFLKLNINYELLKSHMENEHIDILHHMSGALEALERELIWSQLSDGSTENLKIIQKKLNATKNRIKNANKFKEISISEESL